jgi:hypothetical protein
MVDTVLLLAVMPAARAVALVPAVLPAARVVVLVLALLPAVPVAVRRPMTIFLSDR